MNSNTKCPYCNEERYNFYVYENEVKTNRLKCSFCKREFNVL